MKLKTLSLILFIGILFSACKEDDPQSDYPTVVSVSGKVNVVNEYSQPLYEERDSVNIYIEKAFRNFSSKTDLTGKYQFNSLPIGNYLFKFSKPGYGSVWLSGLELSNIEPNYQVVDKFQIMPSVVLKKKANTVFENVLLQLTETYINIGGETDTIYGLAFSANMMPAPSENFHKGYRIFIGESEDVSKDNYLHQIHGSSDISEISLTFTDQELEDIGLESGDSIFVKIYGDFPQDITYTNPNGTLFFPNLLEETAVVTSVAYP